MIRAIQEAYYLNAKNPSDVDVLTALAEEVGCDVELFRQSINSEATHNELQKEIQFARQLGVQGFPSLVFINTQNQAYGIRVDYNNADTILEQIEKTNLA